MNPYQNIINQVQVRLFRKPLAHRQYMKIHIYTLYTICTKCMAKYTGRVGVYRIHDNPCNLRPHRYHV